MNQTINALPENVRNSLKEVTTKEIFELRLKREPLLIIKSNDKLYVIVCKDEKTIEDIKAPFENHKCSNCANFFNNKTKQLCPKVADIFIESYRGYSNLEEDLKESKRIEKYSFITGGIEYTNSAGGFFVVSECSRFKPNGLRTFDEKEASREWFDTERVLTKELKESREEYCNVFYQFGYTPQ